MGLFLLSALLAIVPGPAPWPSGLPNGRGLTRRLISGRIGSSPELSGARTVRVPMRCLVNVAAGPAPGRLHPKWPGSDYAQ